MLWETDETSAKKKAIGFASEEKNLEKKLLPYDILGNLAHVKMLNKQGYLSSKELKPVKSELKKLYDYEGDIASEDVHTFVEEKITTNLEAGKKIHTGRSRNDQVILDTRLLMKDSSIEIGMKALELIRTIEKFSENKNQLIPGYTHQQQAMPSSTGLWASSFADALIDDLKMLKSVHELLDQNPLGAAASYGTSLDIDREHTAELLGFDSVQENSLYCGNRGKQELMLLQALNHFMLDLQKMAEDTINFSEDQEIFDLPDDFCTGSSIMPQKKNPDVLEIIRAKAEDVNASNQAIHGIISKLPSGYNRDTQLTKKHLIATIETLIESLEIMEMFLSDLEVSENYEIKNEVYAAYTANQKVEEDVPFREAYQEVKKQKNYVQNKQVKQPEKQGYDRIEKFWKNEHKNFQEVKSSLLGNSFETSRE